MAAHDLIPVEADGKCQFVVDTTLICSSRYGREHRKSIISANVCLERN